MTSKLLPSDPASSLVIRQITSDIVTFSAPFYRFGRLKVGGRGTIVRLQSGSLAVFSPTALTAEVRSTVQSLGDKVSYIAAPDIEHHIYLSDWSKAYPDAALMAPEGLPEKREKSPETKGSIFKYVWTAKGKGSMTVNEEFDREFDVEFMDAHANKELVFHHKPSRTIIEADALFNLPAYEQFSKTEEGAESGLLTKFFIGLNNTRGDAKWQKRFLWYVSSSANRPSFNNSAARIASWDFDRIIPCHGDVIENGAKGIFQKVYEWHLKGNDKTS